VAVDCGLDMWVANGEAGPQGLARLASLRRLLGASPREDVADAKELGTL
jgi:ribosome biogenesis GTPase